MRERLDPIQMRKVTANVDRAEAIRTACMVAQPGDGSSSPERATESTTKTSTGSSTPSTMWPCCPSP